MNFTNSNSASKPMRKSANPLRKTPGRSKRGMIERVPDQQEDLYFNQPSLATSGLEVRSTSLLGTLSAPVSTENPFLAALDIQMASTSGLDVPVSESIECSTDPEKDKLRRAAFDVLAGLWEDPVSAEQHQQHKQHKQPTKLRHNVETHPTTKHDPNGAGFGLEFDSFIMPDETFLDEGHRPKRRRNNLNSPTTESTPNITNH